MRTVLLVTLTLLSSVVHAAEVVWKWVDAQGVTHYSDRPVPGAEKVELRAVTTTVTPAASSATAASKQQQQEAPVSYRNFEIRKPTKDQVFFNVGGKIEASVRFEPALQRNHTLSLYLDGALVDGFPPGTTDFVLNNVFRGSHQLTALITDSQGKRIAQTEPVIFHVRQTSVANPQQNSQRPTNR